MRVCGGGGRGGEGGTHVAIFFGAVKHDVTVVAAE